MAGTRRRSGPDLGRLLIDEPWRFDALQAWRLIEDLSGTSPRFASRLIRDFPAGEVTALRQSNDGIELEIAAFGLADILPDAYLDLIRAKGQGALRAFLHPFDHRLHRLRLEIAALPRPDDRSPSDIGQAIEAILGLATPHLPKAQSLRATAGLIARRAASLEAIAAFTSWHLAIPVRAQPFAGERIALPRTAQTRIGQKGQARVLSHNAILGRRAFNASAGIRLTAGPLPLSGADVFAQSKAGRMIELSRYAAGPTLTIHCELAIEPASIDGTKLDRTRMLGQTSFLGGWRHDHQPVVRLATSNRAA